MKFRCLAEPAFVIVEAANAEEAQNAAFARYVLDLSPSRIAVDEVRPDDPWTEDMK